MNANSWCCEIVKKTFKLFQEGEFYDDTCERGCIFFYWEKIGIDKQFCENCKKLCEKEKERLEKDSKEEVETLEKSQEVNKNCANCKGLINWKIEKGHIECHQYEDKNWKKRGIFGHAVCDKHQISFCQECENECCSSTPRQRAYCSKKCMDELEDKEERQYWLKKATREEIYSELERRKSLHKKEIKECWECHRETDDWKHEYDDNYQCRDCYNDLIEQNKKWSEADKKKKIECSECGKTKLLGYRKNCYTIYCKECWEFIKERNKDCYEWCAKDCPFKIANEQKLSRLAKNSTKNPID